MENCIVLTGGGTAGHVSVNIKLKDELKKHFNQIVYIGSKNGIENELIKRQTDYKFQQITTVKFERKKIFKNFLIPFKLKKGEAEAKKILKEVRPSVVFSKGGYVGLPVVIAAKKLNIPVVCHESDLSMGLANKLAKNYATKICTNFAETAKKNGKKCIHTGMPLKVSSLSKAEARKKLNIFTNKPILLVSGGSLGAAALNKFIYENITTLTQKFYVYHLVGKNNFNKNINVKDYKQVEFSNDMQTVMRASDFSISRAGANTIFELLSNEILTIFVPLPKSASRGDQIENAKYMQNLGVALSLSQSELEIKKVQNLLKNLEKNAQKFKNKIKNAKFEDGTQKIINAILSCKK